MKNLKRNFAVALLSAGPMFAQLLIPEIQYTSTPNFLKMPERTYMGEAVGVATDSKGNVYVSNSDSNNITKYKSSSGKRTCTIN